MRRRLRVPSVLVVAVFGCHGESVRTDGRISDAAPFGDGNCSVVCFPDGTDAGVCPDPLLCVREDRTCPAGCMCSAYCFPRTAQGQMNCPTDDGLDCAGPDRTCPDGCDPVS
jgi:hypothetical protein